MSVTERPPDCECQHEVGQHPCWECYVEGFDTPASKEADQ
jgi:hypothetical protein